MTSKSNDKTAITVQTTDSGVEAQIGTHTGRVLIVRHPYAQSAKKPEASLSSPAALDRKEFSGFWSKNRSTNCASSSGVYFFVAVFHSDRYIIKRRSRSTSARFSSTPAAIIRKHSLFSMSALSGDGCVGTSIVNQKRAGTHCIAAHLSATLHPSLKKSVAGCGNPIDLRRKAAPIPVSRAALPFVAPVLAARMGTRKGCRLNAPQVTGFPPRSGCRPDVEIRTAVINTDRSESIMAISTRALAPVLSVVDGIPTTLSTDVARHFGKRHEHVLDSIRNLLSAFPKDTEPNFRLSEYTDPTGRTLPVYRLTRDGFTLLAMGFTGKKALRFKLAYIDAFNQMEAQLQSGATPQQLATAFDMAAEVAKQVQQTVFEAVLNGRGDDLRYGRWMFGLDMDYAAKRDKPWAKPVPRESFCLSPHELAKAVGNGDVYLKPDELVALHAACANKLGQRYIHMHEQLCAPKKVAA